MLNIKKLFNKICAEIKSDKDWITSNSHAVEQLAIYGNPIGAPDSQITIPNASTTKIATITLPKGRWFIHGYVAIGYNSDTKLRGLYLYDTNSVIHSGETSKAFTSTAVRLNVSHQITITEDNTQLFISVYQNSGSSITISANNIALKAIRISTPAEQGA